MRSWRIMNKRAGKVRRRRERQRQREWAISFTRTTRFAERDDDIQEYWWRNVLGISGPVSSIEAVYIAHRKAWPP